MYQIEHGIWYANINNLPHDVVVDMMNVSGRYRPFEFPITLVFRTERNLAFFLNNRNIKYVIMYEKSHPNCYDATIRAMKYIKTSSLEF